MKALLDVIFPLRCAACRRRGGWICPACRASFVPLPASHCRRCAEPLSGVSTCSACWNDPPAFGAVVCPFVFEGPLRAAILRFKYHGARYLAEHLAGLLANEESTVSAFDTMLSADALLVPIPLHPTRLAHRGYNQSALIARHLARRRGLAVVPDGLRRVRDTPPQQELPRDQRQANVKGAFAVADPSLAGKSVILVDDVCTTTATLREAARVLRRGGATSVDAIVLARAPHHRRVLP